MRDQVDLWAKQEAEASFELEQDSVRIGPSMQDEGSVSVDCTDGCPPELDQTETELNNSTNLADNSSSNKPKLEIKKLALLEEP